MRGWLVIAFFLAARLFAADAATHVNIAGRDVAVWKPEGAERGAEVPLIMFSHGFGGCNTQSVFLMEALADAGYLVVAPNHKDAHCGSARGERRRDWNPEEPFTKANRWSEGTYRDRREDIEAVLNAVLRDREFEGVRVDRRRIGIAGHSLGGYTALGMAGAWSSWKEPRFRAVLALSPFNTPFLENGDLGRMDVPVMYQGGSIDFGISPTVRKPGGAYDRSSPPKYYVEFRGAGHFAWTDLNPRFHAEIDRYSVAFFDAYLKDNPARLEELFRKRPRFGISQLRSDPK